MPEYSQTLKLDTEIYNLERLKCNLNVIALGMEQETLGEDRLAVESCAEMLSVIHDRMKDITKGYQLIPMGEYEENGQ